LRYLFSAIVVVTMLAHLVMADDGERESTKTLSMSLTKSANQYKALSGQLLYKTNITDFVTLDILTSMSRSLSLTEDFPKDSNGFSVSSSYLSQAWWNMSVGFDYNRTHNERKTDEGELEFIAHSKMSNLSPEVNFNISDDFSANVGMRLTNSSFAAKVPLKNLEARYSDSKHIDGSMSYKYTPTTSLNISYGIDRENGWNYGYQYRDQFIDTKRGKKPFNLMGSNASIALSGNYSLGEKVSLSPRVNMNFSRKRDREDIANDEDSFSGNMSFSVNYTPVSVVNISCDVKYNRKRDDYNNELREKRGDENFFDYSNAYLFYSAKVEVEFSEMLTLSSQYEHSGSRPRYFDERGTQIDPIEHRSIAQYYKNSFSDKIITDIKYMMTDRINMTISHAFWLSRSHRVLTGEKNRSTTNNLNSTIRYEFSDELTFTSKVKASMTDFAENGGWRDRDSGYGFELSAVKSVGDILQSVITYKIDQDLEYTLGSYDVAGLTRALLTDLSLLPVGIVRPRFGFGILWDVMPGSQADGNLNVVQYSMSPSITFVPSSNLNISFSTSLGWVESFYEKKKEEMTRQFQYHADISFSYQMTKGLSTNLSLHKAYDRNPSLSSGFTYTF